MLLQADLSSSKYQPFVTASRSKHKRRFGLTLKYFVLNSTTMPQFVIEREVPGAGSLSEAQIKDLSIHSLEVLKEMGPQIQWLHSYVTEDKVYCVYLAPDEDSIREHARRVGIPADRVSAVRRLIDPAALN
jgi:Nickel responsive protein SCO4226-like